MQIGGLNFDAMITEDGKIFVIELGPRAGGNMIPEVTKLSCGVDLLSMGVRAAAGMLVSPPVLPDHSLGYYSSYMVHAKTAGELEWIEIAEPLVGHSATPRLHQDRRPG